ncbi:unnamed protein product [Didymodactylos carnosus]|uniref:Uncharacterized protein n=1 Tax=Didymodactylos carnosus TaxID=1234261 RepID=A0A815DKH9_9BILA|nr:unnamed protein product [Didymodactylos carnosus]CAF4119872.1 unnamed protein product [Didymodactylos carnosus]
MPSKCYLDETMCNVSCIDYSEVRYILNLTSIKQKRLSCQRLFKDNIRVCLLLKRTYNCVCEILDSDCKSQVTSSSSISNDNHSQTIIEDILPSSNSSCKRKFDGTDDSASKQLKLSLSNVEHKTRISVIMDKHYDIRNENDFLQFLAEFNNVKAIPRRYLCAF